MAEASHDQLHFILREVGLPSVALLDHLTAGEAHATLPDTIPDGVAVRMGEWVGVYAGVLVSTP